MNRHAPGAIPGRLYATLMANNHRMHQGDLPVEQLTAPHQIILIGPVGAGKTTIGSLLAARFDCPFASLDRLERSYTLAAGYNQAQADALRRSPIPFARYSYRRQFFDTAVLGFLADYLVGVLDLLGDSNEQQFK